MEAIKETRIPYGNMNSTDAMDVTPRVMCAPFASPSVRGPRSGS